MLLERLVFVELGYLCLNALLQLCLFSLVSGKVTCILIIVFYAQSLSSCLLCFFFRLRFLVLSDILIQIGIRVIFGHWRSSFVLHVLVFGRLLFLFLLLLFLLFRICLIVLLAIF